MTSQNIWPKCIENCAIEDTCQSKCQQLTFMRRAYILALSGRPSQELASRRTGTLELEVLCCIYKLQGTWVGKRELLLEEADFEMRCSESDE